MSEQDQSPHLSETLDRETLKARFPDHAITRFICEAEITKDGLHSKISPAQHHYVMPNMFWLRFDPISDDYIYTYVGTAVEALSGGLTQEGRSMAQVIAPSRYIERRDVVDSCRYGEPLIIQLGRLPMPDRSHMEALYVAIRAPIGTIGEICCIMDKV